MKNKLNFYNKVLYLHGRPIAHPMHTALAKSVGSKFYPVDKYMRWQDTGKKILYRIISWFINALTYPVKQHTCILVDNLHFSPVIAKKLGLLGNKKIIVHLGSHTLYFMYSNKFSPWVNKMHKYALRNYDILLCEGKMAAELVENMLGDRAPITYITYLGIPSERYVKLNRIEPELESKSILIIANGPNSFREWYKGLDLMIRAYAMYFKPTQGLSLTILGAWNEEIINKNLTGLQEEVKKTIHFIGTVKHIEQYLEKSSLCLHCTRGDAFPTSTLEVMAAGVIPLVSEWTGTKEVIQQVDDRLVVPLDEKEIAKRMDWFFSLTQEKKQWLSSKCRQLAEDYTEEKATQHYQNTFKQIQLNL